ncbi:MAG: maltose/maltodextrin ABC transporter substrate-binding protein MalE [Verrucomicrobia bacterium]|nr:maltose/maltodextrin ABC transporter substrate-binding protein MalE [Verrucomicrobiota bacterium]
MNTIRLLLLTFLAGFAAPLFAWTNGELLIWMDADRAQAILPIAQRFQSDLGIKVKIEAPEKVTDNYPIAAQRGKGPDVVVWAHDKVGEWAEGGLIAPIEVSDEYKAKFLPQAWDAVTHNKQLWGYPLSFEVVGLIYNKQLVSGPPPSQLSDLAPFDEQFKRTHPGKSSILWQYSSPFYSWGILASAGAYTFAKTADGGYDLHNVGVAAPGAVEALTGIINLVHAGVLPKGMSDNSMPKELMSQGKLAMTITGPWDWPDFIKKGIDFGVAPVPGTNQKPGRAFIGVSVAYIDRGSPNRDLAREFLEDYFVTDEGLGKANEAKPIGLPALRSLYDKLAKDNPLLQGMKTCSDNGEIMPNIPQMGRFWSAMSSAMEVATNGQAAPQVALRQAAETMAPK